MNKKTIYLFGNPLLTFDNLPYLLKKELQKNFININFVEFDPNENLKPIDMKLSIIDTVINFKKVKTITDLNQLEISSICSLHDLDLAYNIKLLEKIGKLNMITIFGIPANYNPNLALKELTFEINKYYDRI